MALPDASKLETLGNEGYRALAERLREVGFTPARATELAKVGRDSSVLPRHPLRAWRARKATDVGALAYRMLCANDPIREGDAARVLGPLLDRCVAAGLVVKVASADGASLVSPFALHYANDILMLCDDLLHNGDAVMGAGETTGELLRMAYPSTKRGSVLDMGCGSGTIALFMARVAARVIGTDINPRAISFGRINAALNGLENIEWRESDLFASVADERFDLIVSQPPFVPRHEGAANATFLFGGVRGDELVLRALRELPKHLAPGGRAVLFVMWPEVKGERLEDRIRTAVLDKSLGVSLLLSTPLDMDDWATVYSIREHPTLGPDFEAATIARREHLDACGVTALRMSATIIERPLHERGWTCTVPVGVMSRLGHEHVDTAIAGHALMAGPAEALLAAKLRAPPSAIFADDAAGQVNVRFDFDSPWLPLDINAVTYALVRALDEAPTVAHAIDELCRRTRAPRERVLAGVEQALAHGVVEVAPTI